MKVAITSTGESASSPVDQRFGRARMFLVHDLDTGSWVAIDNSQDVHAAHGAGIQAAQHVVDQGVAAVLTGDCGPKATAVLEAAGVAIHTGVSGTVEEALVAFKNKMAEGK